MRYSQLRAFDAVVQAGSFSRAAQMLGVTQPAVSLQVASLERAYGADLIHRGGPVLSLTIEGQALFVLTRQMFSVEAEIEDFPGIVRIAAARALSLRRRWPASSAGSGCHLSTALSARDLGACAGKRHRDMGSPAAIGGSTSLSLPTLQRMFASDMFTWPSRICC